MRVYGDVAEQYADFSRYARSPGGSPSLAAWASAVAEDAELLAWLAALPPGKAQPNLVFAAARWHGVAAPGPYAGFRDALLGDDGPIRQTVLTRSTQTNEVGRLATLLPAFAVVASRHQGAPLSLLEVGASAGLCLYPDRWSYRWHTGGGDVTAAAAAGAGGDGVARELTCAVTGTPPLPASAPEVARRAGVDLNPLEVTDPDAMAWLRLLVWPEQDDRRALLDEAVAVAATDPPLLERGDLLTELPRLVEEASTAGPVVVFHSAVIAYLPDDLRPRFQTLMTDLVGAGACHWVSNEGPQVLPHVTATGPAVPDDLPSFVLGLDGRAVAWTHAHGRSMTWLASDAHGG